jgi:hypothetical protein
MPRVITKIEGRGNGIKTVISNMSQIALALRRDPSLPTKVRRSCKLPQVTIGNRRRCVMGFLKLFLGSVIVFFWCKFFGYELGAQSKYDRQVSAPSPCSEA